MTAMAAIAAPLTATDVRRPRRTLRGIGAVLAGFLAIAILSSATDAVLHASGLYPPVPQRMADELFLLAIAYRFVYGVAGSWLTARLAPANPMRHALVLGGIGTVLSIAGAAAMWQYGPAWYSLGVIAMAFPCAWLGARLAR